LIVGSGPLTNIYKAGDYNLVYVAYYSNYYNNKYVSNPFKVQIVDACNPHPVNYAPRPSMTAVA